MAALKDLTLFLTTMSARNKLLIDLIQFYRFYFFRSSPPDHSDRSDDSDIFFFPEKARLIANTWQAPLSQYPRNAYIKEKLRKHYLKTEVQHKADCIINYSCLLAHELSVPFRSTPTSRRLFKKWFGQNWANVDYIQYFILANFSLRRYFYFLIHYF